MRVTKNKAIADIANVSNKEMVIGENRLEAGCLDLFADGYHHEAKCR